MSRVKDVEGIEYVLVAHRHTGEYTVLESHVEFEKAASAALKYTHGFVSVPLDREWTTLVTEFGYDEVAIHKCKRITYEEAARDEPSGGSE